MENLKNNPNDVRTKIRGNNPQCSAKGLNWKKMALKRKIHGWDRMIMLNTGTALKYSNLGEVTTFLGKIGLKNHIFAILPLLLAF